MNERRNETGVLDGRQEAVARLAGYRGGEPVHRRVGKIEVELDAESLGGELRERLGDVLGRIDESRILGRIRVGGARTREVTPKLGRVERQEVPLEEGLGTPGRNRVRHRGSPRADSYHPPVRAASADAFRVTARCSRTRTSTCGNSRARTTLADSSSCCTSSSNSAAAPPCTRARRRTPRHPRRRRAPRSTSP